MRIRGILILLSCFALFLEIHVSLALDYINYGVNFEPAVVRESDLSSNDSIWHKGVLLSSPKGLRYICILPSKLDRKSLSDSDSEQKSAERSEISASQSYPLTGPASSEINPRELLAPLRDSPLHYMAGWWTYQYKHEQHIRQYREDADESELYHMGMYDAKRSDEHIRDLERRHWKSKRNMDEFDGASHTSRKSPRLVRPYFPQIYTRGSICFENKKPRETEVRFYCSPNTEDYVESVKEMDICQYLLTIRTPRICPYTEFYEDRSSVDFINCTLVVSDAVLKDSDSVSEAIQKERDLFENPILPHVPHFITRLEKTKAGHHDDHNNENDPFEASLRYIKHYNIFPPDGLLAEQQDGVRRERMNRLEVVGGGPLPLHGRRIVPDDGGDAPRLDGARRARREFERIAHRRAGEMMMEMFDWDPFGMNQEMRKISRLMDEISRRLRQPSEDKDDSTNKNPAKAPLDHGRPKEDEESEKSPEANRKMRLPLKTDESVGRRHDDSLDFNTPKKRDLPKKFRIPANLHDGDRSENDNDRPVSGPGKPDIVDKSNIPKGEDRSASADKPNVRSPNIKEERPPKISQADRTVHTESIQAAYSEDDQSPKPSNRKHAVNNADEIPTGEERRRRNRNNHHRI